MARRFRGAPSAAGEIVARILADQEGHPGRSSQRRGAAALRVFRAFSRLGPPITSHAEPVQFRAGVLSLTVDDSAWLTELSFLRPEMLERLNRMLGRAMVTEIRLRHAPLSRPPHRPEPLGGPPALTAAEQAALDAWSALIADEGVRAAMRRAGAYALAAGRGQRARTTSPPNEGTPRGPSTPKPGSG
jgi:hypothetical protein